MRQRLVKQHIFNRLLRYIDSHHPGDGRHRKLSNALVLYHVLRVLIHGTSWRDTGDFEERYSWQAVYKRYKTWTKNKTIDRVFYGVIKRYVSHRLNENPGWFNHIFVDATLIKNVEDLDCCDRNPTDRGRNGTKLSAVCDRSGQIITVIPAPAKVLDKDLLIPTIDSIQVDIQPDHEKTIHVVGDKGYSIEDLGNYLKKYNRRFTLIAEKKRNCKRPVNNESESNDGKKMIAERHTVERSIGVLKKFKRIFVRYDTFINNFMSFVHLGIIIRAMSAIESI